jgi:hypothetical protein
VIKDDVEYVVLNTKPNPVMSAATAGLLTPISPQIWVIPVFEIPACDRITSSPAVARFTPAGPAAKARGTIKATISIAPKKRDHRLMTDVGFFVLVFIKTSLLVGEN